MIWFMVIATIAFAVLWSVAMALFVEHVLPVRKSLQKLADGVGLRRRKWEGRTVYEIRVSNAVHVLVQAERDFIMESQRLGTFRWSNVDAGVGTLPNNSPIVQSLLRAKQQGG
jgi:hypothetical protein